MYLKPLFELIYVLNQVHQRGTLFRKQFFILDNNAVQTEESSAENNKTNINGDKKCNESESTDEDEMKRINSEEEKLDRDLTQRLMAKYWKPRKSIAHRLKGKLCS